MELRVLNAAPAVMVDPDHPAIRIAAQAFSDILGKPTVLTRNGGSIPVVGDFATHLGIPTILMGFGLPDDGLHSPNEKYRLGNYYTGIMTIAHFFEQLGDRYLLNRDSLPSRDREGVGFTWRPKLTTRRPLKAWSVRRGWSRSPWPCRASRDCCAKS